jgi:hypothetical protein
MNLQELLGVGQKSLNTVLGLPSRLESLLGVNTGFIKPGLNQAVGDLKQMADARALRSDRSLYEDLSTKLRTPQPNQSMSVNPEVDALQRSGYSLNAAKLSVGANKIIGGVMGMTEPLKNVGKFKGFSDDLLKQSSKLKSPLQEGGKMTPIYRYQRKESPMGKSKFFGESEEAIADFGTFEGAKLEKSFVDEASLYKGGSSYGYLMDNSLMDKPHPIIKKLTNNKLETPQQLWDYSNDPSSKVIKGSLAEKNPNVIYAATQQIAAEDLTKKGFKGAVWSYEDDLIPKQYQIWDNSILKSQPLKSPLQSSISKAKSSGQSFDEWVKGQTSKAFHGSDVANIIEKEGFKKMPIKTGVSAFGEGSYLTSSKANAKGYGGIVDAYLPKDIKLKKVFDSDAYKVDTQKLIKEGFDGVELETGQGKNITIFDPSKIKTRSQLKAEWDKVK